MINSLYIKNLAIIDELEVHFENGLNIITGETGSGKSILVNAIAYLLGGRFSKDHMRTDSQKTIIEGNFQTGNCNCTIRRVISANGNSRIFVDDEPIKLNELPQITNKFIDMHGQHDHQQLLLPSQHLSYVDQFGDYDHILEDVLSQYSALKTCKSELLALKKIQTALDEKKELFTFQLEELDKYELEADVDSKLSSEYEILTRASEIIQHLENIDFSLDKSESSIVSQVSGLKSSIAKISHVSDELESIENRLESTMLELSDLAQEVKSIQSNVSVNPNRLVEVEEKLSHIEMLKRKFGGSMLNVIDYRDKLVITLLEEQKSNKRIPELEMQCEKLLTQLNSTSTKLSNAREETAVKLSNIITGHVREMDMPSTQFNIKVWPSDKMTESGNDECEFFIQTNLGEESRPLAKIVSGGEISRIMLAIKLTLQKSDKVDTLIFDEIDSGISGATAERVGDKINALGDTHQIICISHLSQIAGKGKTHFKVKKNEGSGRTQTSIKKLNMADRVNEIASLISGHEITETSLQQAAYLLEGSHG
ncbi:MAG: DNA repair protein RecN [Candidatus Marinimicrobia bacterium]|nr:DNA repair protein RecN [Candidatus Neomarinimicrobiota bacterium]MBT7376701.1 DNA repair protein RecN [Candidatus Neomarinimicrobiota bacterium]